MTYSQLPGRENSMIIAGPEHRLGEHLRYIVYIVHGRYLMRIFCLLLFLTIPVAAGNIFVTEYEYQADICVYVVDYEYQADICVYVVDYEYQADDSDALWFFVEYEYQADVPLYYVEYEYQADLNIFFVEYEYQAGWEEGHPWMERLH